MPNFEDFVLYYDYIGNVGQTYNEAYRICQSVESANHLDGEIVEIGVERGGTAKIIRKYASQDKKIFLFDTFEGLVYCSEKDGGYLSDGLFEYDFNKIFEMFKDDTRISVHKGIFPESGYEVLKDKKVALVHLDVDTYQSTLDSLHFIYDKIVPGGIIIIHDYINNHATPGVKLAVDSFFIDKSDSLVIPKDEEIFNTQIIITKK